MKLKLSNIEKKIILVLSDTIIILFSISFAYSLRLETIYLPWDIDIRVFMLFFLAIYPIFFYNNIYQILLRYFDYFAIKKIIKSLSICFVITLIFNLLLFKIFFFPRSISIIAIILTGIFIIFHRISLNFIINLNLKSSQKTNKILIFGISKDIVNLIKTIRDNPSYGVIKGLIDLGNNFGERELNGLKIYKKNELENLINKLNITEIIIVDKTIKNNQVSKLISKLKNKNIRIKKFNETKNFIKNYIDTKIISSLNFYDIIDRPKIIVQKKILSKKIKNKNILVTGGGGSIGSELCLEILKQNPNKLFILDISEINLFNIKNKIDQIGKFRKNIVKIVLGDCNDENFLSNYFNKYKVDEIYHAAAYKHVNFGEENPYSMIKNNIFSTKKVVEFALKKKIKHFTFISSDKAVNPKSILGCSKSLGEKIINQIYLDNKKKYNTSFTIVRFGNVIGSSGSVIPIFLNQLIEKNYLTVTNKNVTRYFMSISEAVQLTINASYLNKNSIKIYALDMGKQIKIIDIARRIIRLSGYTIKDKKNPNGDIFIKLIGLKKGEKLSEEIALGKNLIKTNHQQIYECDEKIKNIDLLNFFKEINNNLKLNSKNLKKQNFLKKFL